MTKSMSHDDGVIDHILLDVDYARLGETEIGVHTVGLELPSVKPTDIGMVLQVGQVSKSGDPGDVQTVLSWGHVNTVQADTGSSSWSVLGPDLGIQGSIPNTQKYTFNFGDVDSFGNPLVDGNGDPLSSQTFIEIEQNKMKILGDADSSTTATGCLILSGGLGVAKNAHFGGNVGIGFGSTAAGEKLDVNGKARAKSFVLRNSASDGSIELVAPTMASFASYNLTLPNVPGNASQILQLKDDQTLFPGELEWKTNAKLAWGKSHVEIKSENGEIEFESTAFHEFKVGSTSMIKITSDTQTIGVSTMASGALQVASTASFADNTQFKNGVFFCGATSGHLQLLAAAATTSYSLTFPAEAGDEFQFLSLVEDQSAQPGVLEWVSGAHELVWKNTHIKILAESGDITHTTPTGKVQTFVSGSTTALVIGDSTQVIGQGTIATGANQFHGTASFAEDAQFKTGVHLCGSTSGAIQLGAAPATTSYSVSFPAAVGTDFQILSLVEDQSTNGGVLEWVDGTHAIIWEDTHVKILTESGNIESKVPPSKAHSIKVDTKAVVEIGDEAQTIGAATIASGEVQIAGTTSIADDLQLAKGVHLLGVNSGHVKIQASDDTNAAGYTLILPENQGSAHDVLTLHQDQVNNPGKLVFQPAFTQLIWRDTWIKIPTESGDMRYNVPSTKIHELMINENTIAKITDAAQTIGISTIASGNLQITGTSSFSGNSQFATGIHLLGSTDGYVKLGAAASHDDAGTDKSYSLTLPASLPDSPFEFLFLKNTGSDLVPATDGTLEWSSGPHEISWEDSHVRILSESGDVEHKVPSSQQHLFKVDASTVLTLTDVGQVIGASTIATGAVQVSGTTSFAETVQMLKGIHLVGTNTGSVQLIANNVTTNYKLIMPPAKDAAPNNKILAMHSDEDNVSNANLDQLVWARVVDLFADDDGDTKITLDNDGTDNDTITFVCDGATAATMQKTVVTVDVATESTASTDGALVVAGGVGIAKDFHVGSVLAVEASSAQTLGIDDIATGNLQLTGTSSFSGNAQFATGVHLLGATSGHFQWLANDATTNYKLIMPPAKDASPNNKILAMHDDEPNNLDRLVWARVVDLFADGDGDTKITLDNAGTDNDTITFLCNSVSTATMEETKINLNKNVHIPDGISLFFGQSNDFQIIHSGATYLDEQGTGGLFIRTNGPAVTFCDTASTSNLLAQFQKDGACELYFNKVKRIETTADGALVTGDLSVTGDAFVGSILSVEASSTQTLGIGTIDTGNMQLTGTSSFSGNAQFAAGVHLLGATSGHFQWLANDATTDYKLIMPPAKDAAPNNKILAMHSDEGNNLDQLVWARVVDLLADDDGDTKITLDNAGTDNDTITFLCNNVSTATMEETKINLNKDVHIPDAVTLNFGTGNDLQIKHDGNHTYISENGQGNLAIRSNGNGVFFYDITTGSNVHMAHLTCQGPCILFDSGDEKIRTSSDGAKVTGDLDVTSSLRLQDDAGSKYVGLDAPATVTTSYTLTLPASLPIGAYHFLTLADMGTFSTDGTLEWAAGPHEVSWTDSYVRILGESGTLVYHTPDGVDHLFKVNNSNVMKVSTDHVDVAKNTAFTLGTVDSGALRVAGDASFALNAQIGDTLYLLDDNSSEPKNSIGIKAPAAVTPYTIALPPSCPDAAALELAYDSGSTLPDRYQYRLVLDSTSTAAAGTLSWETSGLFYGVDDLSGGIKPTTDETLGDLALIVDGAMIVKKRSLFRSGGMFTGHSANNSGMAGVLVGTQMASNEPRQVYLRFVEPSLAYRDASLTNAKKCETVVDFTLAYPTSDGENVDGGATIGDYNFRTRIKHSMAITHASDQFDYTGLNTFASVPTNDWGVIQMMFKNASGEEEDIARVYPDGLGPTCKDQDVVLTGTISVSLGSTAVTGTGTAFTTELKVGEFLREVDSTNVVEPQGEIYEVAAIISDTRLSICSPASKALSGVPLRVARETTALIHRLENVKNNGSFRDKRTNLRDYATGRLRSRRETRDLEVYQEPYDGTALQMLPDFRPILTGSRRICAVSQWGPNAVTEAFYGDVLAGTSTSNITTSVFLPPFASGTISMQIMFNDSVRMWTAQWNTSNRTFAYSVPLTNGNNVPSHSLSSAFSLFLGRLQSGVYMPKIGSTFDGRRVFFAATDETLTDPTYGVLTRAMYEPIAGEITFTVSVGLWTISGSGFSALSGGDIIKTDAGQVFTVNAVTNDTTISFNETPTIQETSSIRKQILAADSTRTTWPTTATTGLAERDLILKMVVDVVILHQFNSHNTKDFV